MVRKNKDNMKEVVKALQLIGPLQVAHSQPIAQALLNLLHKLFPILTLLPGGNDN
jgi:hypothetical protein